MYFSNYAHCSILLFPQLWSVKRSSRSDVRATDDASRSNTFATELQIVQTDMTRTQSFAPRVNESLHSPTTIPPYLFIDSYSLYVSVDNSDLGPVL